jgi:ATP-dependent Clp protease ATP-binding subunit ClpB
MPIRWDKFTVKAQEAVQRANDLASEHGNPELQPHPPAGRAARRQRRHRSAGARKDRHRPASRLVARSTKRSKSCRKSLDKLRATRALQLKSNKLLEQAFKEAANFKDEYVSTEHLLLAITHLKRDPGPADPGPSRRDV